MRFHALCAFAILGLTAGPGVAEDVKTPQFPHCDRLATDNGVVLPALLPPTNASAVPPQGSHLSPTNAARSARWQSLRLDRDPSVISGMSSNMVGQERKGSREQEAKEKQAGDALRQTVMEMTPLVPPVEEGNKNKGKDLWIITRPEATDKNARNPSDEDKEEASSKSRDAHGWEKPSDVKSMWGTRTTDPANARSGSARADHGGLLSSTPLNVPLLLPGESRGMRDENAARAVSHQWTPSVPKKETPPPPATTAVPFTSPFATPEPNTSGKPDGHPFAKPAVDFNQKPVFQGPFVLPKAAVAPTKSEDLMDRWEKYLQERKQQRGF